jgi:hypothetical protein
MNIWNVLAHFNKVNARLGVEILHLTTYFNQQLTTFLIRHEDTSEVEVIDVFFFFFNYYIL